VRAVKRDSVRAPKQMINCSTIEHTNCDRAHLCVKPTPSAALFWKFCFIRVLLIIVAQGLNPTIFRVSRILLDSINRLVSTEKHTRDFEEELTAFKKAILWVYSFPLFYFMKKNNVNIMCN
jgi:hypothetical protein